MSNDQPSTPRMQLFARGGGLACVQDAVGSVVGVLIRPLLPSTVSCCPVVIRLVAFGTPTTAGMPYSRATTAPWELAPPISMTSPPAVRNRGVHPGSVEGATRISPGWRWAPVGSSTTRAWPVTVPAEAAVPTNTPSLKFMDGGV